MRHLLRFLGLLFTVVAFFLLSCSIGSKLTKTDQTPSDTKAETRKEEGTPQSAKKPAGASEEELRKLLEPPPTPQQLGAQTSRQAKTEAEAVIDLNEKEEVNRHALEFARQIPNVKHVKTCFSKLYGGWYMLLYIQKGKKVALDQYSWSRAIREWEIVYRLKEIPAKQLEAHVKVEVGDEKCFVLK